MTKIIITVICGFSLDRVHDLTREHTKEVERLKREADEQREGREQAVARVVELQSQLESYFLKFGSLDLSEGNTP